MKTRSMEKMENHMVLNTADAPWNQPDADEPTLEEKAEAARIEARDLKVAEYADGLRQLADFYEEHPEMALPEYPAEFIHLYEKPAFLAAVKTMAHGGKVEKKVSNYSGDENGGDYQAIREFGPVRLIVSIPRKTICRLVTPAVYDCPDSLLEAATEYAEQ